MAEVRYNNQSGKLATVGTNVTNSTSATTINFAVAPNFATLTAGQTITLALDAGLPTFEIVYLTAYTAGATTGTVTRAAEDSAKWPAVAHPVATTTGTWNNAPTVNDFPAALPPNGAAAGDLTGTYPNPTLATSGVTGAGTPVGSTTTVPVITYDAKGRLTTVTSATIASGGGGITALTNDVSASGTGSVTSTVNAVKGVALTAAQATILSQMNNAINRTSGGSVNAGEQTAFTGSNASQILAMPGSSTQNSTVNTILNVSSNSVGVIAGSGTTLNLNGVSGSFTVPVNSSCQLTYVSSTSTWYVTLSAFSLTGDVTTVGAVATLANAGPGATGPFGSTSTVPVVTIDAKGRVTALTTATITPGSIGALSSSTLVTVASGGTGAGTLTGLVKGNGTVAMTAAAAGTDYVAPGGALGTPSSGTLTNATGLPVAGVIGAQAGPLTGDVTTSGAAATLTPQATSKGQDLTARGGAAGAGSIFTGATFSTTVAAGSNGVSLTTLAGGTALSVAAVGGPFTANVYYLGQPATAITGVVITGSTGAYVITVTSGLFPTVGTAVTLSGSYGITGSNGSYIVTAASTTSFTVASTASSIIGTYTGGGTATQIGYLTLGTSGGTAKLGYTGTSGNTYTGISIISGTGAWTIGTGGSIVVGSLNVIPDVIQGASVSRGDGSTLGVNDWATVLNNTENNLAGLVLQNTGLVLPFYDDGLYGGLQWTNTSGGTASTIGSPVVAANSGAGGAYASSVKFTSGSVGDVRTFRRVLLFFQNQTNGAAVTFATTGAVKSSGAINTNASGLGVWDSGDLGYTNVGTGWTATYSAAGTGTSAAGVVLVGALYIQSAGTNGTININIAKGGTRSDDYAATTAGYSAFLTFLNTIGFTPRRYITGDQVGNIALFGGSSALVAPSLATHLAAVKAASPLTEIVLYSVYTVGTVGTPGVGDAAWSETWVPLIKQAAITNNVTYLDAYARFGDLSYTGDAYGLTCDFLHMGSVPGVNVYPSKSGRNGQESFAEFFFDKLEYSKAFATTGNIQTGFAPDGAIKTILSAGAIGGVSIGLYQNSNEPNPVAALYSIPGSFFTAGVYFGPGGATLPDTWINRVSAGNMIAHSTIQIGGTTGAIAGARWAGSTTGGAPVTGTYAVGDWITTTNGQVWVCTVAGTTGTWYCVNGNPVLAPATATGSTVGTSPFTIASPCTGGSRAWVLELQNPISQTLAITHGPSTGAERAPYPSMATSGKALVTLYIPAADKAIVTWGTTAPTYYTIAL